MTTKLEQEFFEAMGVAPTMLTDCSYKNMQQHRYEYGDDNCEHLDDFDFSCDMCPKSRQYIPYYPPITDTIVLRLEEVIFKRTKSIRYGFNDGWYFCTNDELKETSNSACRLVGYGTDMRNALLRLCIQLKDEIRQEVKKLF